MMNPVLTSICLGQLWIGSEQFACPNHIGWCPSHILISFINTPFGEHESHMSHMSFVWQEHLFTTFSNLQSLCIGWHLTIKQNISCPYNTDILLLMDSHIYISVVIPLLTVEKVYSLKDSMHFSYLQYDNFPWVL